jgi:ABC-type enterochelin transport system substrate-binding protein
MLAIVSLFSVVLPQANMQNANLTASSYQAFSQLAQVYRSGGTAPDLVAKLNVAITKIQEAQVARGRENVTGAVSLEEQARSAIAEVENAIPAAQASAQQQSATRTLFVAATIPVAVFISAFIFYASLRTWRWYEKEKLFEMRIVEKKETED